MKNYVSSFENNNETLYVKDEEATQQIQDHEERIEELESGGSGGKTTMIEIFSASSNVSENTLDDSIENYDLILFVGFVGDRNISSIFNADFIKENYTASGDNNKYLQMANDSRAINWYFTNGTTFKYYNTGGHYIKRIYGIKF